MCVCQMLFTTSSIALFSECWNLSAKAAVVLGWKWEKARVEWTCLVLCFSAKRGSFSRNSISWGYALKRCAEKKAFFSSRFRLFIAAHTVRPAVPSHDKQRSDYSERRLQDWDGSQWHFIDVCILFWSHGTYSVFGGFLTHFLLLVHSEARSSSWSRISKRLFITFHHSAS